ncbi:MAG: lipid-A-disaccharide synthase [Candidatus Cloacimonetes bacterium]|nr:lipid-A-disaccharide synthase [Candidatus Cloacimonadota bacterium]MCF7813392.1 lipid-A-disaccharide synthase [Candidatus Cloacimonadota bacterium]MCF7867483.1 lipid-A-disaccharide synthase [Candidatus Cloacimonadota bacterium]MCF7883014.1 lipid-A-disaccharide synthase [Candidatus Cloacimonadota bacterium]
MIKKIFWIAGEKSGDLHASIVLQKLKDLKPDWVNFGIGGPHMQEFGFKPLFPFERFSVMGFSEILKHILFFWKVEKKIKNIFRQNSPDLIILVDYPGLNMRIAKMAESFQIPVLYFISPQFWAWKYKRIFKLKKFTDQIAYILPFEKKYFAKHEVNSVYVGHPIAEEIEINLNKIDFAKKYKLNSNKKWLGFLPGSRDNEIKKMLPEYLKAMTEFNPETHEFLLSRASSVNDDVFKSFLKEAKTQPKIIESDRYEMIKHSDFMVVTSGTATIETAFLGTPFLIAYRTSKLSYELGKRFIKIDRIGLPNIVLDKDLIPELIQNEVNGVNIAANIKRFLESEIEYEEMKNELKEIHDLLQKKTASTEVAKIVTELIDE